VVVLNALGDTGLRYLALLLQDIPRSCKLDSQLNYVDVALGRWSWRRCRWVSRWRGCRTWRRWKGWCVTRICNLALGCGLRLESKDGFRNPAPSEVCACMYYGERFNAWTIWSARYWPASARCG
jgi:hypothetical protein